ncbi:MAG: hypothetical protein KatS3mg003_1436 [Candidatus Nitrosocaldaceae archaeon]|nr:MAG: hypothetical protein KatS3mg003_1436 [Candidatus Nitrosocaldaceae archaeon]
MVEFDFISVVIGAIFAFITRLVYDKLREPKLEIATVKETFIIYLSGWPRRRTFMIFPNQRLVTLAKAYRLRVFNKQKSFLNAPADNCVVWLELDDTNESYQLSWVGQLSTVTINIGDKRDIDLCALLTQIGEIDSTGSFKREDKDIDNVIVVPTEHGYTRAEECKLLAEVNKVDKLTGKIRVSSANGKIVEKRIRITYNKTKRELDITLS